MNKQFQFLLFFILAISPNIFSQVLPDYLDDNILVMDSIMPEIVGNTLGNLSIDSTYFSGKVTIVSFMQGGCAPCVFQYSYLNKIRKQYPIDLVNVLSIMPVNRLELSDYLVEISPITSSNPNKLSHSKVEPPTYPIIYECEDQKINCHIGRTPQCRRISRLYGIQGTPTTFIIDKNQIVRFKHIGFTLNHGVAEAAKEQWRKIIDELLVE